MAEESAKGVRLIEVTVSVHPHIIGPVVAIMQGEKEELILAPDDVDALIEQLKAARDEARQGS